MLVLIECYKKRSNNDNSWQSIYIYYEANSLGEWIHLTQLAFLFKNNIRLNNSRSKCDLLAVNKFLTWLDNLSLGVEVAETERYWQASFARRGYLDFL